MARRFLFSLVASLLVSSTVLASIGQTQGLSFGAFNDVIRSGCVGSAESQNVAAVGHAQKLYDAAHQTTIRQEESARLTQNAGAAGSGGKDTVSQNGSIEGNQSQYVRAGHSGIRTQEQSLGANLETLISHKGAVGRVSGEQNAVGSQSQKEASPNGFSEAQQSFRASQLATVSSGPHSNVTINSGVTISLGQSQFLTGGN